MPTFFISYRREDGSGYAGRIYDHLVQSFGQDRVFMDVDAIEPGQDFVEVIQNAVGSCSALIAVVGRNWLGVRLDGSRRIDDPEDFVHLEVATALERGVRVIPVLVDDAETPKSTELPPRLQALARRNAVRASHTSFRAGIDSLIRAYGSVGGLGGKPTQVYPDSPSTIPFRRHGDGGTSPAEGWLVPTANVFWAARTKRTSLWSLKGLEEGNGSSPAETSRRPHSLHRLSWTGWERLYKPFDQLRFLPHSRWKPSEPQRDRSSPLLGQPPPSGLRPTNCTSRSRCSPR
jgi:hypothetical protein